MRRLAAVSSTVVVVAVALLSALTASARPVGGLPGGEWVVFTSSRDGDSELYAIRPDGSGLRRLTRNSVDAFYPSVSPDGTRIAFVSSRDGDDDIYVMQRDGTGLRRLTSNGSMPGGGPVNDEAPAWSPDGTGIAFASNRTGQFELYVMGVDSRRVRRLTRNGPQVLDTAPAWSPDGRTIAFGSDRVSPFNTEIFTIRPSGDGTRRLTFTGGSDGVLGDDTLPSWSPGGDVIAFTSNRDQQNEVYVMRADGSDQRRLLEREGTDDLAPRFSPDGTLLVFTSHGPGARAEVWVVAIDGSGARRLTEGSDGAFSP
jgi:Tol biopolymer transport system component